MDIHHIITKLMWHIEDLEKKVIATGTLAHPLLLLISLLILIFPL